MRACGASLRGHLHRVHLTHGMRGGCWLRVAVQTAMEIEPSQQVLMPGEELVTTCTYDSTSRNKTTTFGESTTDEMCFNFLFYYPRIPAINICTSINTRSALGTWAACTSMNNAMSLLRSNNFMSAVGASKQHAPRHAHAFCAG